MRKKGGGGKLVLPPSTFQSGGGGGGGVIVPSSFSHEVALVKFELQTHMEHPSSCCSGGLVILVLLNFQFSVYS